MYKVKNKKKQSTKSIMPDRKEAGKFFSVMIVCLMLASCLTGCVGKIKQDSADSGKYSTQTPKTALEYSVFLSKQVNICAGELETRMQMARQLGSTYGTSSYKNEYALAGNSLQTMNKTLNTVKVTMPSDGREKDREALISAIETAITHMKDYRKALKARKDVTGYIENFHNDFIEITGLAQNYQE